MTVTNKPQQWGPNHDLDDYHTMPGVFAKRLQHKHGLDKPMREAAWMVDSLTDEVEKVEIVRLLPADNHYTTADYAVLSDTRRVPTLYLFPVKKHTKPVLKKVRDEFGTCQQWVAPWRKGVYKPFD